MSIYTAGISNVGSYLVSGRPWLKTSTIADGAVEFYHFPKVTKQITIHNDHQGAGHDLFVAFPEPRMAANLADSGNTNFTATFTATPTITVSGWFKYETLSGNARLLDLTDSSNNSLVRLQNNGTALRIVPNNLGGSAVQTSSGAISAGSWHHFVVTVTKTGSNISLYLDGNSTPAAQLTSPAITSDIEKIALGHHSGTNFDGLYSDIFLFNDTLTSGQATALFNGVGSIDPRNHSKSGNLVSWWAFENNFYKDYFATPDTGTTIFDRVSSNNLLLGAGGSGALTPVTFGIGRHHASVFYESQSYLLDGQENMTIEAKSTFMSVKCSGGSLDYSIHASLTGIDPERMGRETGLYD